MAGNTKQIWEYLIGNRNEFSKENRTVNAVGIITLCILILVYPINFFVDLKGSAVIVTSLLVLQTFIYYLSRFRKMHQLSMAIYAYASYIALIVNYRFNAGIDGPTIMLFFLTFQLLVALTPKSQHFIWVTAHIIAVLLLLINEYLNPSMVWQQYGDRSSRFIDVGASYIIALLFIYIITIYLLNSYNNEKKLAQDRADAIEKQNKAVKHISWVQSHKVRNHVATILGLTALLNDNQPDDPSNKQALSGIKSAANELDKVIREINNLAEDAHLDDEEV